jgi:hypothetical protein
MHKQMSSVLNNKWTVPVVVGVTSFTLGAISGYFFRERKAVLQYDAKAVSPIDNQLAFDFEEEELGQVIPINRKVYEPQGFVIPDEEFSEFELDWDAEMAIEEDELEAAEEIVNIFAGTDEEWDYEAEINRRGSAAYILHVDEFVANELDYDQHTMTYYVGDDILADENDVPIYNFYDVVGELRFGHGSKDPSLVYIRSEKLRTEWEVIRHTGSFEIEVRGLEIESEYESQELRHARSPQRFRMD